MMENERKCKLSRLRLKNSSARNNNSPPESSQISKYFMRNRTIPDIIEINDNDDCSETSKSNEPIPSTSRFVDLEDENEFGETEPPQFLDDSALCIKMPPPKSKSNITKLKAATSRPARGRSKKGTSKSTKDRKQPKIKNAFTKQSSFEDKYSAIVNQQLLAEDFNPDDMQLAIALSNSINEQCVSQDNEDCFPDTQERIRNIKTTLEQFGFKNSKSVSSDCVSSRQTLRKARVGSLLFSRTASDREKIIEKNVGNILKDEKFVDQPVESPSELRLVSKDLLNLVPSNLIFNVHKLKLDDDISTYSARLIDVDFTNMEILLKNWRDIPGRERTPLGKCNKKKLVNNDPVDYEALSKRKSSPEMVTEANSSSLGKSFSNYTKIIKTKNKVILDTNILDKSIEIPQNNISYNNKVPEIEISIISPEQSNKNASYSSCKKPVRRSSTKINKEENKTFNKSTNINKNEVVLKVQRSISPNLFDSSDDEIIESSLVVNDKVNKTEDKEKIIPIVQELSVIDNSSDENSVESLELRANANVDFDLPKHKDKSLNITLDRFLRQIDNVKNPFVPEMDVMDETIPNLSDFSEDSLILCEQSPTKSKVFTSPEPKKRFQLDYNKLGRSYLRNTRKKNVNLKTKDNKSSVRNLETKTKSVSQMEQEFLEHLSDSSMDEPMIVKESSVPKILKISISQLEKKLCDEKSPTNVKVKRTSAIRNIFKKRSVSPLNKKNSLDVNLSSDDDNLKLSEILTKNFYKSENSESASNSKILKQAKYGLSLSQKSDRSRLRRNKSSSISPDSLRARDRLLELTQCSDNDLSSSPETSYKIKSLKNKITPSYRSERNVEIANTSKSEITTNRSYTNKDFDLIVVEENSENAHSTPMKHISSKNRSESINDSSADEIIDNSTETVTEEKIYRSSPSKIKGRPSYKSLISKSPDLSQLLNSSSEEVRNENNTDIKESQHFYPKVICINENDDYLQSSDSNEIPSTFLTYSKTSATDKTKSPYKAKTSSTQNQSAKESICLSDNEDVELQLMKPIISRTSVKKDDFENGLKALKRSFSDSVKDIFSSQTNEDDLISRKSGNSYQFSSTLNKSKIGQSHYISLKMDYSLLKSTDKSPPAKRSLLGNFNENENLETFVLSDDDEQVASQQDEISSPICDKNLINEIHTIGTQTNNDSSPELRLQLSDLDEEAGQKSENEKSDEQNKSAEKSTSDEDVFVISDEELNYSINTPYKIRKKLLPEKLNFCPNSPTKSPMFDESFIVGNSSQNKLEQDSCSSYDEMRNYFPCDSEDYLKSPVIENIDSQESSTPNIVDESIDNTKPTSHISDNKTLSVSLVNILESPKYSKLLQSAVKPKPKRLTQLIQGTSGPATSNNDLNNTDFELNQLYDEVRLSYIEKSTETPISQKSPSNQKRSRDPFISSPSTPTVLIVPDDCPYEVRKHNVTPVPDFERMATPDRLEMLDKYGLKKMNRNKAHKMLKYIYDQTHPIGEITPEKKKKRESDQKESDDEKCAQSDYFVGSNGKEEVKSLATGFQPERENEEYYLPTSRSVKILGCAVPLHISFFNYVDEKPELRGQILRFDPVDLDEIHVGLKEQGYRYDPKDLLSFMDKRCITVKTKNRPQKERNIGNSQTRRKKTKKQVKESAERMESIVSDLDLCSQMSKPNEQGLKTHFPKKTSTSSVDSLKEWNHEKRFKPIEISDSE